LGFGERLSGDNGDLLLLVELGVELCELVGDLVDEDEALVLGQDGEEIHGDGGEVGGLGQDLVERGDFFFADATVLGEQSEIFRVLVEFGKVDHVFVDLEESGVLGSGGEKNTGIASFDGVLLAGRLVVGGGVNNLDVANRESFVGGRVGLNGRGHHGFLYGDWLGMHWFLFGDGLGDDGLFSDRLGNDGLGDDGFFNDGLGNDGLLNNGLGNDGLLNNRLGNNGLLNNYWLLNNSCNNWLFLFGSFSRRSVFRLAATFLFRSNFLLTRHQFL